MKVTGRIAVDKIVAPGLMEGAKRWDEALPEG